MTIQWRKAVSAVLGLLAAAAGLVVVLPTIGSTFQSAPQRLLTEFPFVPVLFGTAVTLWGLRKPRLPLAIVGGLAGIVLGIQPLLQFGAASQEIERAMAAGLGPDYLEVIPAPVRERLSGTPWSLSNTFGGRTLRAQATTTFDVTYIERSQRALRLDVYEPETEPPLGDRFPAIISVHGGSWRYLDKGGLFETYNRYLASTGYVVFDIQYRFSDEAVYPAQIEDVLCAVAWVRAHADNYRVDPARIALLGRSAGGHLALLAAYGAGQDCETDGDSRVQAVVGIYPPTELRMYNIPSESLIAALLGESVLDVPAQYAAASPTAWVRDDLPPTLLIVGGMDNLVLPEHGELLANLLRTTNTPVALLRVPWARHGFDVLLEGLGSQLVQPAVDHFLAWSLYHE